jgi:hypothetical protein
MDVNNCGSHFDNCNVRSTNVNTISILECHFKRENITVMILLEFIMKRGILVTFSKTLQVFHVSISLES